MFLRFWKLPIMNYDIDQVKLIITNFLREIKPTTTRRPIPYHYTMTVTKQALLEHLSTKEISLDLSMLGQVLVMMDNLFKLPLEDGGSVTFFPARLRR